MGGSGIQLLYTLLVVLHTLEIKYNNMYTVNVKNCSSLFGFLFGVYQLNDNKEWSQGLG